MSIEMIVPMERLSVYYITCRYVSIPDTWYLWLHIHTSNIIMQL